MDSIALNTANRQRVVQALERRLFEINRDLEALRQGWGETLINPPPWEEYQYDPYLCWALPSALGRYHGLLAERAEKEEKLVQLEDEELAQTQAVTYRRPRYYIGGDGGQVEPD